MILYANGCSWTAGGGLEPHFVHLHNGLPDNDKRLSLLWPHHLGSLLRADQVHNLANGCGSNQRILRKTYNWLLSKTPEELAQTVAVIQFTEWSRFEKYDPPNTTNIWEDNQAYWVNCKIDVVCTDIQYTFKQSHRSMGRLRELKEESAKRISETHSIEDFYRTIGYAYALKGMFDSFGVKDFYIWHQSHLWHNWPEQHRDALYNNFKVLDDIRDPKLHHAKPFWEYDRVGENDRHPGLNGHKQLAFLIRDAMISKGYKA